MGVRGLQSFCYENQKHTSIRQQDLRNITLAVDYSGFLYYACNLVTASVEDSAKRQFLQLTASSPAAQGQYIDTYYTLWILLGGCTIRFTEVVTNWLNQFETANIQLYFLADPPSCFSGKHTEIRKRFCLDQRENEKIEALRRVSILLEESDINFFESMNLSKPEHANISTIRKLLSRFNGCLPFADKLLRDILHERGMRVRTCDFEADEELAKMVQRKQAYAVLSRDSDFFIMKNARYIPFEKISVTGNGICANIFESKLVAASLNVQPENLVDLALLCTNDFTDVLDQDFQMASILEIPRQSSQRDTNYPTGEACRLRPSTAADWIKTHGSILRHPKLQAVEVLHPGFLFELEQFYAFYGHRKYFERMCGVSYVRPTIKSLSRKKKSMYLRLLDYYGCSMSSIELIENSFLGCPIKYDAISRYRANMPDIITADSLLADFRLLLYATAKKYTVLERTTDQNTGKNIVMELHLKAIVKSMSKIIQPEIKALRQAICTNWENLKLLEIKSLEHEVAVGNLRATWMHATAKLVRLLASALLTRKNDRADYRKVVSIGTAFQTPGIYMKEFNEFQSLDLAVLALLMLWRKEQELMEARTATQDAEPPIFSMRRVEIILLAVVTAMALSNEFKRGSLETSEASSAFTKTISSVFMTGEEKNASDGLENRQSMFALIAASATFTEALKYLRQLRAAVYKDVGLPTQLLASTWFFPPQCPYSAEIIMAVKNRLDLSGISGTRERNGPQLSRKDVCDVVQSLCPSDSAFPIVTKCWAVFSSLQKTLYRVKDIILDPESSKKSERSISVRYSCAVKAEILIENVEPTFSDTEALDADIMEFDGSGDEPVAEEDVSIFENKVSAADKCAANVKTDSRGIASNQESQALPRVKKLTKVERNQLFNEKRKATRAKKKALKALNLVPAAVMKQISPVKRVEPPSSPQTSPTLQNLLRTLPVYKHRRSILHHVANHQITIIQGETGCGKSTSVPQFILDEAFDNGSDASVNIFVTQPRRIAAIELATTVAKMRECNKYGESGELGDVVGYQIGQQVIRSAATRLTYVTTGYMMERLLHGPLETLQSITHLVLDEVHERTMDVDLILLTLRYYLHKLPQCRVVLMSATMDTAELINYFKPVIAVNCGPKVKSKTLKKQLEPLHVGSRLFEVDNVYLDTWDVQHKSNTTGDIDLPPFSLVKQYLDREKDAESRQAITFLNSSFHMLTDARVSAEDQTALNMIRTVHNRQILLVVGTIRAFVHQAIQQSSSMQNGKLSRRPCILVFLPGIQSINLLYERLSIIRDKDLARPSMLDIFVLHSDIELDEQEKVFAEMGKAQEDVVIKIILATNIAESSVTIPNVTHVFNCGIEKQIRLAIGKNAAGQADVSEQSEILMPVWCSRASTKQRAGRAGRVCRGVALHLFTAAFEKKVMLAYGTPEIVRKPLTRSILLLEAKLSQTMNATPRELLSNAIQTPNLDHIDAAYSVLADFDALDSKDEATASVTPFGKFVSSFPLDLALCRLFSTVLFSTGNDKLHAPDEHAWLVIDVIILSAALTVPDLFISPSKYHASSAVTYMEDMKQNLISKLQLDDQSWSEPLAIWRLYRLILKQQIQDSHRHRRAAFSTHVSTGVRQLLSRFSISIYRYKSLNYLIADLCKRTQSLLEPAKNKKIGAARGSTDTKYSRLRLLLRGLETVTQTQQSSAELVQYAYSGARSIDESEALEQRSLRILRVLLVMTYRHHMLRGEVQDDGDQKKKNSKQSQPAAKSMPSSAPTADTVVLSVKKSSMSKKSPNSGLATVESAAQLFAQCCVSNSVGPDAFGLSAVISGVEFRNEKIVVACSAMPDEDLTESASTGAFALPLLHFPISLLYYIRDQKYPIEFMDNSGSADAPDTLKMNVHDSNGKTVTWFNADNQSITRCKISIGSRSIFQLPLRTPLSPLIQQRKLQLPLRAVYTSNILSAGQDQMTCSRCTLLPPDNELFYLILLLVCASRNAIVRICGSLKKGEIVGVRVNQESVTLQGNLAMLTDALEAINQLREQISSALQSSNAHNNGVVSEHSLIELIERLFENDNGLLCRAKCKDLRWSVLKLQSTESEDGAPIAFPPYVF